MKTLLLAATALVAISLPLPLAAQVKDAPAAVIAVDTPSANLQRLFLHSDEDNLRRNPLFALVRGDTRYADQFGDFITDEYLAGERDAAKAELAALAAINRSKLTRDEQISYDVFKWQRTSVLKGYDPAVLNVSKLLPIDHFRGLHQFVPDIFSGTSVAPFNTVKDYEDNLKRLDGFAVALDRVLGRMKEGVAAGVVQPRLVTERVLAQLDRHVTGGVDAMPLMMPVNKFPEGISPADQARLKAAYTARVRDEILPRYTALRDYTRDVYLPASRSDDRPGLVSMPGGPELYRHLVSVQTTTDMTPEEIHELGLREVARVQSEMKEVMKQVGFKGSLQEFFAYIQQDPKFKPASREALTQGYYEIGKRVETKLPRLFRTIPKTPLEIRPYPEFLEKDAAGGSYMPGAPDGSRPGIFYFNAYDLPSRTTPGMETLYLHEGAPGHHFQIALSYENAGLPSFQRFGGNTAFVEGWALYAESLGKELGMFTDPYQYYGRLDDEMLRAMRLVVDTGLHAKGWSRQQAIDYMLANSSQGETDVVNEVDRYVAMPAQALAYKVGDIRIQQARQRAEKALGRKFDIRAFHDQVLMSGALPLEVLDAKIDAWIAEGGK